MCYKVQETESIDAFRDKTLLNSGTNQANWFGRFKGVAIQTQCPPTRLLGSLVVRGLDSRLDGRKLDSQPPRLILGWVTVFGWANHVCTLPSHPGQLSLLSSAGR